MSQNTALLYVWEQVHWIPYGQVTLNYVLIRFEQNWWWRLMAADLVAEMYFDFVQTSHI